MKGLCPVGLEFLAPGERVPTLQEIGAELGISVGKLREQLELARSFNLVSVRPRVGIQREPLNFAKVVLPSVLFGLGTGEATFAQVSQLRKALETNLWHDAVVLLTEEDKAHLKDVISRAWGKLRGNPVHVPNGEHREFHLLIFSRLENPFVRGLLEVYWEAYEASELTRFASYDYWLNVWHYHEKIADALCAGDYDLGRELLIEHFSLLPASPTA